MTQAIDLETLRLIRDLYQAITEDGCEAVYDAVDYLHKHCPCPPEERIDRSPWNKTYPLSCGLCGRASRVHLVVKR